jgi:hypothetical protein
MTRIARLYPVRYRGCHVDEVPYPGDQNVGKIELWTAEEILRELNRDRGPGWIDYDETDDFLKELDEWTFWEPLSKEAR